MKIFIPFVVILFCSFTLYQPPQFKKLYALAGGTWQMKTKKGYTCEHWQKVNDNELQNQGFRVAGNDTTMVESVQLIQKEDGIYYIPTVKNQNGGKPVPFKMTAATGNQFTFANPEHDYPQLIVYDFVSADSLHAWVDGHVDGKNLKIDYYYKRVN